MGRKTAYIEMNTTNEIQSLSPKEERLPFCHMGIDIFPCKSVTSLPEILRLDYEYFVIDMAVLNTYTAKEFSRCDKQFIVCSFSKWKRARTTARLKQLLNTTMIQQEHVTILENFSMKESKLSMSSMGHSKVLPFPFVQNPFQLDICLFHALNQILKGV